jgi:thiamine kinase-like enzyme
MKSEDEAAIPPGAVFIDYEYAMTAERGYDIGYAA